MSEHQYEVGQELLFVPADIRYKPVTVRIRKIGRKWAELDGRDRFDLTTGWVDGGDRSSPGRVYASNAEYEAEKYRQQLWKTLRSEVDRCWSCPSSVTTENIRAAMTALGMPEKPQ